MTPQRIVLVRGDDYSGEAAIVIDASGDDSLDLTAFDELVLTARRARTASDVVWGLEATVSDASTAYVDLPEALWDDWAAAGSPETMHWDVQGSAPARTLAIGTITVEWDVTR